MRLIDSYGVSDVPYEQVTLLIDDGSIIAQLPDSSKILMAEYSSIENAKKAMKMLHIEYAKTLDDDVISRQYFGKPSKYFTFPNEEHLT